MIQNTAEKLLKESEAILVTDTIKQIEEDIDIDTFRIKIYFSHRFPCKIQVKPTKLSVIFVVFVRNLQNIYTGYHG